MSIWRAFLLRSAPAFGEGVLAKRNLTFSDGGRATAQSRLGLALE